MLLRLIFLIAIVLPITTLAEDRAQDSPSMILIGSKEKVLSTIQEALDLEFTNGIRTNLIDRVGFKENFTNFWSGKSELLVAIFPMANGNSLEPTAYKVDFRYPAKGKSNATSLIARINSVVAKKDDVTSTDNYSDYIPLGKQIERCVNTFDTDQDLKLLKDKVSVVSAKNQTFDMLANDNVPTEEERRTIHLYAIKREECMKSHQFLGTFWPNEPLATLDQSAENTFVQLILSLYKGELTYGNFAKIRKDNFIMLEEARSKIALEKQKQASADDDRAKRLSLEQQRLFIERQKTYINLYKSDPLPVQTLKSTTCNFNGNQMYCTSF